MSDAPDASSPPPEGATAGAMIRAAREKRGTHIAALAAAMKVPQRKLEALEADRYDELPDLAFARALAQSVCRSLKIDAQPVLERLPQPTGTAPKLQHVSNGLNAPFREHAEGDGSDWSWLGRPVVWGTALVLVAAAAVAFLPEGFFQRLRGGAAPAAPGASSVVPTPVVPPPSAPVGGLAPAAPTAVADAASVPATPTASLGAPETVEAPAPAVASTAALKPPGAALLAVRTTAESWVEVQDARGQTLLSRKVAAGEAIGLDGEVPLRLTIGNAAATQVSFRGRAVDLSTNTVANVARLQLD